MSKPKKLHYAFIILLAVSLIRGFSGPAINASSGLFLKPVSEELGTGVGQLALYLSVSSVVSLFWLPIAGKILNKYPVKLVAVLGALLQAPAFIALGFAKSVWYFYILSIPMAMGAILLVNLLGPILINRWFAANQGVIMGVMMTITSLLGAVFQPLLSNLIASGGWRNTYIIFGGFALCAILLIALVFLKSRPEDMGSHSYAGIDKGGKGRKAEDTTDHNRETDGVTAKAAVKTLSFYMLLLFMIVITAFASFSQYVTTFGLDMGYTMAAIGTALSLSMIGSAVGSILIGLFSDRIGVIATSISVVAVGLISISLFFFGGHTFPVFAAAALLHGLASSSIGVIAPILTTSFFGKKEYEKLFSLVMMGAPLASIILIPAFGFVYDYYGTYNPVLVFLLGALVVGAGCILIGKRRSDGLDLG